MKKVIIFLVVLLFVLLMLVAVAIFDEPESSTVVTAPSTTESIAESTEPPTTEPPTTQPTTESTEPEPQLLESGKVFIVNGVRMSTFVEEGTEVILVGAAEYIDALGLDEDGSAHASDKEMLTLAEDGLSLSVGEKTYEAVYAGKLYVPIYELATPHGWTTSMAVSISLPVRNALRFLPVSMCLFSCITR